MLHSEHCFSGERSLSGLTEPSPPWHTCSFVRPQVPQRLRCETLFLELAVSAGRSVCPTEFGLVRKEELPSQAFCDMTLCNIGLLLQLACEALDDAAANRVGTQTPKLEWDTLHSSSQCFLTLCVCVSQWTEKGCGGNKRADGHLLLFLPGLDWYAAAFLLPDHPGDCDENSAVFVGICCLTSAFESLKQNYFGWNRPSGSSSATIA